MQNVLIIVHCCIYTKFPLYAELHMQSAHGTRAKSQAIGLFGLLVVTLAWNLAESILLFARGGGGGGGGGGGALPL